MENKIISFQRLIKEEVARLTAISAHPAELYDPINYTLSLGGKRIRPLLVLLGCDLFDGSLDKALSAGIGMEFFHNFTLVHDDIMDNAPLRRGKETVHQKWNTSIGILSGDAMFVKAYQLLMKSHSSRLELLLDLFNRTALQVCEGQQLDMNYEKEITVTLPQYLRMIELKTAVLLAACLKMGAMIAGAEEQNAQHLYEFGKNIGIAFQLQDDLLDVYGDEEKFGKQKGGDIIANKKTWLLLKAQEMVKNNHYKAEELSLWLQVPAAQAQLKIEAVTAIYDSLQIKELAEKEMMKFYDRGLQQLKLISADETKKQQLAGFVNQLMERQL